MKTGFPAKFSLQGKSVFITNGIPCKENFAGKTLFSLQGGFAVQAFKFIQAFRWKLQPPTNLYTIEKKYLLQCCVYLVEICLCSGKILKDFLKNFGQKKQMPMLNECDMLFETKLTISPMSQSSH